MASQCPMGKGGDGMIANRFNPLGRNLGKTAKYYIQDGLLFHWDGIENAGYEKHDDNATVWKDLVGNIDLTLTGETAWSDIAFQLNGAGGAIGAIESAVAASVKTLEVAFKCSVDSGAYKTLAIVGGAWNSMAFLVHGSWVEGVSSPSYRRTTQAYFGTTRHLTRFRDSVARNILVNGAEVASDNGNWFDADDPGTVSIGKNGSRYYYYGDIYAVRCYTRVLTIDEVNQNYAIDKERFSL